MPGCHLVDLGEWPVTLEHGVPITPGSIGGHGVNVMIDTGSAASLVTQAAALRLGLDARTSSERLSGIGGDEPVRVTPIEELRVGRQVRTRLRVRVGDEPSIPGVDLILGEDVLHTLDIELDYAKAVIRVFRAEGCEDAWLAYWDAHAQVAPIEHDNGAVRVPVVVNGSSARGSLDSGASRSLVALELAYRVGLAPDAPGVVSAGCATGLGADAVPAWIGRFDSIRLGGETVRDARIAFADFGIGDAPPLLRAPALSFATRSPEVLLGGDFLRTHRVLVARSQDRVYFSYTGGVVFPGTPWGACNGAPGDAAR